MEKAKKFCVKSIMFLSSYFTLYLMLLILHYDKFNEIEKLKNYKVVLFLVGIFICLVVSFYSVYILKNSKGVKWIKIVELERPDDTIISYMMTYIIPILTTNFINNGELIVNIMLFLLIGYLYIRLNLLYLNPLWAVAGYLSYRINSDKVLVTNIEYAKIKSIRDNNIELKGFSISNDIFVAQKSDNEID